MLYSKMQHTLLPLLVLASVALSSSNLILNSKDTTRRLQGQEYDNIFVNDNTDISMIDRIICGDKHTTVNDQETLNLCKLLKLKRYLNTDNNKISKSAYKEVVFKKDDNYDVKGFRKEQWHNYPRQLDRLQRFLYERHKPNYGASEGLIETDRQSNNENDISERTTQYGDSDFDEIKTNEILFHNNNEDSNHFYDTVIASNNPLLIFKVRLACLSNTLTKDENANRPEFRLNAEDDNNMMEDLETPNIIMSKVDKRYYEPSQETINFFGDPGDEEITDELKSVPIKKRIFSMWSRLQSLTPKGHELHHRRHLHAYYNLPGPDGNGVLSAETRAFSRPPGSPLRWG